jgi:hypothetical protein
VRVPSTKLRVPLNKVEGTFDRFEDFLKPLLTGVVERFEG